jgi:nucleoid DNA-binding protein
MPAPMLTYGNQVKLVADMIGVTQIDVRAVLDAYAELAVSEVAKGHRFRVLSLVQVEPKLRLAQKKRPGRNPRTGEEVMIPAKPASVKIRARVLAAIKNVTPTVKRLEKATV